MATNGDHLTSDDMATKSKSARVAKWLELRGNIDNVVQEWTEEDQAELVQLESNEITMENSLVAKARKRKFVDFYAVHTASSPATKKQYLDKLNGDGMDM
ncbi:MAG: hypothetical protein ACRDL7_04350 [Gaiellaceae bacterium]